MSTETRVDAIARAVLYEGYILWPYRRSALKNQQRWTFGGVYPEAYSKSGHEDDASLMRTECLVELDGDVELSVHVRFLHVVDRRVAVVGDGQPRIKDSVSVNGVTHTSWDEATERQIALPPVRLRQGASRHTVRIPIVIADGEAQESLGETDAPDARPAIVIRRWKELSGWLLLQTEPVGSDLVRVRVDVVNDSPWRGEGEGEPRAEVLRKTFVSTHTTLTADRDAFVSLIDPPAARAADAAACRNIGTWPVLVGTAPERRTLLSSPIILYDYPSIAPESTGDFFDGGEIDQLLVLSILSMTDAEQAQMRATDPRAREILDRCQGMSAEDLLRLHGATRSLRPLEARP